MSEWMNKTLTILMLILIVLPMTSSLGISPGKRVFDLEDKEVTITVHNNDGQDMDCLIEARGELAQYITLSDTELSFTASEKEKSFTYFLDMPEEMDVPGLHAGEIVVKERLKSGPNEDVVIKPGIMLSSQVFVKVPYPGTYATGELMLQDVKLGELMAIYIRFTSQGDQEIKSAVATVQIIDPDGKIVHVMTSDSTSIPSKTTREIITSFDTTSMRPGPYTVNATVNYDGREVSMTGKFEIDEFLIRLLSIAAREFTLGDIANFEATVENIGNRLVEGFNVGLFLKDAGITLADLKSYKIDLGPQEVKQTNIYWDTSGVEAGDYEGKLSLYYEDEKLENDIVTQVRQDEISIKMANAITGNVIVDEPSSQVPVTFYMAVIGLLLIFLVVLIIRGRLRERT